MNTYKVFYFVDEEVKQIEVAADRAGITPEGHLVFERVSKPGAPGGEESQFIAAFASGYWLKFAEAGAKASLEPSEQSVEAEGVIEEVIEEVAEVVVEEIAEISPTPDVPTEE